MFVLFIFIVLYFIYVEKEYPIPNFHLADFSGHFTRHPISFIELHSFLFNFYGYSPYIYCFFFMIQYIIEKIILIILIYHRIRIFFVIKEEFL